MMESINSKIREQICYKTINKLNDCNLLNIYKECNSVKKQIKLFENVLDKYVSSGVKEKIVKEHLPQLIPAGTKGCIKGNLFNKIVKDYILDLKLNENQYEICFEKKCSEKETNEIPDWYILEKSTRKVLIGMNQLDFWTGGAQLNRGFKYIIENNIHYNEKNKLLCVICNEIQFKNDRKKVYKLFEIGFKNDTLCYLNNLKNVIYNFFSIITTD